MKAVTTRSGLAYEGPLIPTNSPIEKLGDPGKFLIPCDFSGMEVCHALADLGVSINIMPLSIWKKLSLPELTPTRMILELADRSITHPKGVAKDVFVKVGKFHFPTDFVVVDFEADLRVPLILGRSFLRTGHALIDVYGEEITLRVNDESVTFNLNQTMRYSSTYDDNSVNRVDVIDIACEEFVQDVLDFQYNSKSRNPTLVFDPSIPKSDLKEPIVKSSSPTLTPFRESDFFLEEIKDFLNDDSIPTGIDILFMIWRGIFFFWKGYFQIPIDPQDQEKTTFTCPYGTFAYRRMPFGLCNAPGFCIMVTVISLGALRRSNRRRVPNIVEPEIRTIEEIVLMADRTMEELLQAPTEGYGEAIDDLVNKFVNLFFPPCKTTHLKNEISRFTQRFEETFGEAWDRFKEMLRACPHHGFSKLNQIDTFYNGLTEQDQDSLNAAAGVEIVNKQVITPASAKAVEKTCVTCGGAHAYYDCIATDSNQPSVCASTGSYNQVSPPNRASHQIPPPGFAPNNHGYRAQMNTAPNFQNKGFQNQPFSVPSNQIQPGIPNELSSYMKSNEIMIKSMQNQINVLRASTSGTLPSNNVPNPKGEMKAVTTHSGLAFEGPSIPANSPFEKVDEQNTEETIDKEHSNCPGSTVQVQHLVVPISIPEPDVPRTQSKPTIPYPSRLNDQKLREKATNQMEKFFQIFHDLHFDISFADALLLMPKFASTIKSLLTNKDKLFELAKVPLNANCSAMLLKNLPENLKDPGKFLIPYDFPRMEVCHALADLGASINLMPLSIWKKLSLPELILTRMTLELVDRSITRPKRVAKDVFVKVGKFHFPTDFVVVNFEADPRVPLILGRSFLRTGHALIDVYGEEITLRYNSKSSNPTLVSDSSIFESDFYFLNDDLISTGIETSVYDPEGDILFLEKLLNEDPFQFPPMDLKLAEESKAKSSVEEPPELELKELPAHLEYAFLEDSNKLPVIIAKDLKNVEKEALINVLKSHNRAIAWKISNIKDQEKTTFTCPYGTLEYRRMPFGLCHAPDTFQRCMMAIFHDMIEKTMEVFMDDFLVFGDSFSSCLTNLDKMLKRCEEMNLVLNWEKCHFMCREGIVLCHKISKSGIEVDRAKVDIIAKLPHSTTVKESFEILKAFHEGPIGGHYGANLTSKKAYWALKHVNFDLKTTGDHRKLQLNELSELHDQAYENSMIYKERTKKLHDSKIKNRIFNVGDQVLLFNSRLKIFSWKLKTRWSGPFTITQVFPYGTIELSQPNGPNFKVNGHRVKHYFRGNIPFNVVPDLHTFPMDK
nr:reverse transcriptase domain-containing protein [Tanacetum cinerariifolium]